MFVTAKCVSHALTSLIVASSDLRPVEPPPRGERIHDTSSNRPQNTISGPISSTGIGTLESARPTQKVKIFSIDFDDYLFLGLAFVGN